MIVRVAGVMDDVVIAQIFFDKRHVHRVALKVHMKNLPLLVEEVFNLHAFPVRSIQVSARIGQDQNFKRRLQGAA